MSNEAIQEISVSQNELTQEAEEAFYLSAEFWVAIAFVLVVAYLSRPVTKIVKNLVQKRINRIKQELNDAENIKLEAQKLYADTERSLLNVDKEIEDIITNKKYLIEQTKERKMGDLNYTLQCKKEDLNAKLEQLSVEIQKEINETVCQKVVMILNDVISAKLTKKEYSSLIDNSIENIKNIKIGN